MLCRTLQIRMLTLIGPCTTFCLRLLTRVFSTYLLPVLFSSYFSTSLFSCHWYKKPDPAAAPLQQLCVWTSRVGSLRGERPLLLRWGSHRTEDPSHSPGRRPIVPFLSPQTADSSAWWTGAVPAPGEWRSLTRAPGAPSVMTAGTWTMPAWCAGSWDVEKPWTPLSLPPSGGDQGPSGWMKWTAEERSPKCGGALPGDGSNTTAIIKKMQESSAQVWSVLCPQAEKMKSSKKAGAWSARQWEIGGLERTQTPTHPPWVHCGYEWWASYTFLL